MPPELRKAHQANDRAVIQAYGFDVKMTEAECVGEVMNLYKELASSSDSVTQGLRDSGTQ